MQQGINTIVAPTSEAELMQRVEKISGLRLSELASIMNVKMPPDLKRHKGWSGQLIEQCLGASAGSKQIQDFPNLGIELKTLPLSHRMEPLETTYVCYAPLLNNTGITWNSSSVRNKLSRVLWIPIQGERDIPLTDRVVGSGFLWAPNPQEDQLLQQDWEELMDMISLGKIERITAKTGQVLQLRPKAANGQALTSAVGENGDMIQTRPRGFYLRKHFTFNLLQSVFY